MCKIIIDTRVSVHALKIFSGHEIFLDTVLNLFYIDMREVGH